MAHKTGGWGYRMPKCGRCGKMGAIFSPYSQQTVCPACLGFERAAYNLQNAVQQAEMDQRDNDAAELQTEHQRIDIANAANYRGLAAESRDPANMTYFGQQAEFYEDRAAQRAGAVQ